MAHRTTRELQQALDDFLAAPGDGGELRAIVRRPDLLQREELTEAELDTAVGLVGDNWSTRGSSKTADGSAHPDKQVTLMNARVLAFLARSRDRWSLAGDQLVVDLDLSTANLPAGARFELGGALLEVTDQSHLGCEKFAERFGSEGWRFVASEPLRRHRLRGMYARVVRSGTVRVGDLVRKA